MKSYVKILIGWFIKWDILLIIFLMMGSCFLISKVPKLKIRADNEVLLNKESGAYQNYSRFIAQFSSDRMLMVLFEGDIINAANLNLIDKFSKKVKGIEGINEVISITNTEGFEKSLLAIRTFPVYQKWRADKKELSWFREAIRSNHFIVKNLLAKDESATIVLLTLNDDVDEVLRNEIVVNVQQRVNVFRSENLKVTLVGVPLEEYLFLNNIKADQRNLVPLIFIFLAIMCVVFLRGWSAIISSLGSIILTILWTQGTVVWCGRAINPITSLLSPVVMVISLAHVIHIFNHVSHHQEIKRANVNAVIWDVVVQVGMPSFLAAVTTAIGFLSLGVSDNPAVKEFGVFAGIASCYSFLISFALSIVVIKKIGVLDKHISVYFPQQILCVLSRLLKRFKVVIFLVSAVVCGVVINGIFRLEVDTKLLNYLKDKNHIIDSINVIDTKFNGSNSLEVVLTLHQGTFFDDENFALLHQLTKDLDTIPRLQTTNSFDGFIMNLHQILEQNHEVPLPRKKRLELFKEKLKEHKANHLYKFITRDFKTVRINCLLLNSSTRQIIKLQHAVDQKVRRLDSSRVSFYVTGRDVLFANMSDNLVQGQMKAMLWAGVPISLMVFLSLMSFRFGIAGLMAMGLPIAMTYGVMGFRGIPLNTATIMISSVAMGLLVDDTIHFLYRFKKESQKEGSTSVKSVESAIKITGKAIIITSVILIGGFSVGVTGLVIPTMHFSILMGLAAFLSLLINVVFLPTALLIMAEMFSAKGFVLNKNGGGLNGNAI